MKLLKLRIYRINKFFSLYKLGLIKLLPVKPVSCGNSGICIVNRAPIEAWFQ